MPQEAISIKGNKYGLVISLSPHDEFDELKKGLLDKFEAAKGFFEGARVIFQYGKRSFNSVQLEELVRICRQHGLIPVQQRIDPPVEEIATPVYLAVPGHTASNLKATNTSMVGMGRGFTAEENSTPGNLYKRSLRSGQRVLFPGNVIIMGNVHPGAEIFAEGNIVIMGDFLGLAHAGYTGNKEAYIIACRFGAGQLRIANEITVINEQQPKGFQPKLARILGDKIVLENYLMNIS
ncbi:MAG: septum site-determining protein MinC [Bacillota bacterium]